MPALFRGLDRQALDLEYSPSALIQGGLQPYLDRYAALSQAALSGAGVLTDLRFGADPDEVLDLFVPAVAGPWPLHIFIHGGFWQALSQRDFAFIGPAFQHRGIAFASINYTIAPAATIGEMTEQCARALAWLYTHASRWRLDPNRITISGHSAGAHLCAMLLSRDWGARDWAATRLPQEAVKGAVLVSGVYDLEPIRLSYVNEPLHLSEAQVAAWSPVRLDPVCDCPIALVWGEHETEEFKRQSRDYGDWMRRHGRRVSSTEIPAHDHFDILLAAGQTPSWLVDSALSLTGA
jgi:arylformamidase